ncbi:uncharacterized protein LOC6566922 [Drosophila grimshawi]|uniref:GH13051 n=1 Tax=Drosophila grimshawi TaxID=7222 RepID=B4JR66_DROGR|nr:uncharacterized protein LOC6566922 [Drosophila grimshawi]EDV99396.1 GH13051 [Drosophila grimshawi]
MHEEIVIKTEEIDIDDTKIKLEVDEDGPTLELSCAGTFMKIIEERPNMITMPVHDCKSEDELKFIASLGTFDQQQKLFVTSSAESVAALGAFACKVCSFTCENHLSLASHQINHQLNRHFCCHGCGEWCNTLEEIQEHEYRKHADGINNSNCRICQLECIDAASLTRHMSSHFYVRRFVCSICRRHFETRLELQLHRQNGNELCGQLEYADMHGNIGQLVAISKLDTTLPAEPFCDIEIKSEPMDVEDQLPTGIIIKTEPQPEAAELNSTGHDESWTRNSLAEQLRSKLRLPAIKKPPKEECVEKPRAPVNPSHIVTSGKLITLPNATASLNRSNILRPKQSDNQPSSILKKNISKPKTNICANVLKMVQSNGMVIKVMPNMKIIKLAPTAMGNTTNSFNIGGKIITLPSSMSISSGHKNSTAGQTTTVPTPSAPTSLQAATLTLPINRNSHFNAISLFESLPESRKIISDIQNQIRNIEQTLPLPGSVLQPKNRNAIVVLPSQLQVLRLPPTQESNLKVRQLRNTYSDHRFHWECPSCARCFEQFAAFCKHLTISHDIAEAKFEHMAVEVKSYKKCISSTPATVEATVPMVPDVADAAPLNVSADPDPVQDAGAAVAPEIVAPERILTTPASTIVTPRPPSSAWSAQYKCGDCSKCFTTMGGLRIHKMIHTGELPHKCNYCEKRFRTPGQVRVHHRRHTGEKPFKCKVCSLDFTHRETLISHLSRHIGMKRYKCYGCDKNFVVVSGLRAHRRLRPDTCGKVKFTARAHGPRVRVIRGEVVFESHPEHNGYLRSEDPLNIMSEINQAAKEPSVANESS